MTPEGGFDFGRLKYVPPAHYAGMRAGKIRRGDILIVKDGATTGKTCFVGDDFPHKEAAANEHVFVCRADPALADSRFLFYWLWGEDGQRAILQNRRGSTIGGIARGFADSVVVPLPSVEEQRRVANRLDKRLAAAAEMKIAAETRADAIGGLPSAFLRQTFAKRGKVSAKENRVTIGKIAQIIRGVSFGGEDAVRSPQNGYAPILRAGNIGKTLNLSEELIWIPQSKITTPQYLQVGDIVICMASGSRAVVGKSARLTQKWLGAVGAFCAIIRPREKRLGQFLYWWFQSPDFLKWRDYQARGANIQNLRTRGIESLEISMPSVAEQKCVCEFLDKKMSAVADAKVAADLQMEAIRALPAAYLREEFADK
jgi:type I restriction enzyme S subunit